jgi:6-phospho-beta-glucosidase
MAVIITLEIYYIITTNFTSSAKSKHAGFIYADQYDYDKGTGKHSLKDNYYWYQKIIQSNGEDLG